MSDSIHKIIERLALIEGRVTPVSVKHGLNAQQKSVPQLPALFKPRSISPVLTAKTDPKNPMKGYMVGDSVQPARNPLEEAMQDVEEDMVSKVKANFADYLEKLEKQTTWTVTWSARPSVILKLATTKKLMKPPGTQMWLLPAILVTQKQHTALKIIWQPMLLHLLHPCQP